MAIDAASLRLFGLDLGQAFQFVRQGWDEALRWPTLSWLSPQDYVLASWPDGSSRLCLGTTVLSEPATRSARFHARVLPADIVLFHDLSFPHLSDAELDAALWLELQEISPFPPEQLVWGWRIESVGEAGLKVRVAFAARSHVQQFLDAQDRVDERRSLEVWADVGGIVVMKGFGEGARHASMKRKRFTTLSMCALALVLALALAAAPFWQMRQRVFDAQNQFEQLQREAARYVAVRDSLVAANQQTVAIRSYLERHVSPAWLLRTLTELLPDSAHLSRFDLDARKVRISGQAADAAGLMEALRAHPDFAELRALSPITRDREGKDTFNLEFVVVRPGGIE
ncbi:MAG TPA: PilN domain-containing protein [Azoarcus taiwanensis]|nr:PilN domain-containing protein [Azoarcus taiwanensis]